MKNFSHLYHQTSKNPFPKKTSTNKAVLNSSGINTFSKNSSMRTFNQFNTFKNSNNPKKQRLSSKSIQQHNGRNLDEERYNKTHKK